MEKFFIHTMGCKSNQFESSIIKENLIKNGFIETENIELAEIYILNSCTVTHKSDNEAFYHLRNAKHKNPTIITLLTGCIAQVEKEKLLEYEFIDYVVGNDEKLNLADIIKSFNTSTLKCFASDIMTQQTFNNTLLHDTAKTRASVKIQDGCDNRCTYCVIPFARGKSRSAKADFVINQINYFAQNDFKEIVFTGIHIGQWGKEFGLTLLDLLKEIEVKTTIPRYRLGSLNPLEISDEMLDFLSKSKKFCPHFHLSLQSACNKTLKSMNRFYTVEDYLIQIEKIKKMFNKPFLGSDIIAGFAGETIEDFETTRENLIKSGLTRIHTFPYSLRSGTLGASLPEQIDDIEKNRRANIIKEISQNKINAFIKENINSTQEILIEKHADKQTGMLKGVTRNYLTILLDENDPKLLNTLVQVKITHTTNNKIYGTIVK